MEKREKKKGADIYFSFKLGLSDVTLQLKQYVYFYNGL